MKNNSSYFLICLFMTISCHSLASTTVKQSEEDTSQYLSIPTKCWSTEKDIEINFEKRDRCINALLRLKDKKYKSSLKGSGVKNLTIEVPTITDGMMEEVLLKKDITTLTVYDDVTFEIFKISLNEKKVEIADFNLAQSAGLDRITFGDKFSLTDKNRAISKFITVKNKLGLNSLPVSSVIFVKSWNGEYSYDNQDLESAIFNVNEDIRIWEVNLNSLSIMNEIYTLINQVDTSSPEGTLQSIDQYLEIGIAVEKRLISFITLLEKVATETKNIEIESIKVEMNLLLEELRELLRALNKL